MKTQCTQRNQIGQSAVEFALVLPILVLILMGIFDFGRAFYAYSVVANAARDGARAGVIRTASDASVRSSVRQIWVGLDALPDSAIVITPATTRVSGGTIGVQVTYQFIPITPVIGRFLPGGKITLVSSSVMQVE
jgi:hypothetical protein